MTEENKSQTAQAAAGDAKQTENFEAKFKEMQAKYEQKDTELKRVQETLDAVTPYINFDAQKPQQPADDGYVSKKEITSQLNNVVETSENRILELQFIVDNPDLKPYKDTLVAPRLSQLRYKFPKKTKEELLSQAATEVREFLETERKFGAEKAKKEKAVSDAQAMSGLESSGTSPKEVVDESKLNEDYIAERRKVLNKKKGY